MPLRSHSEDEQLEEKTNVEKENRIKMVNVVKEFLPAIKRTNGVKFIGLIGSLTRDSPEPKDIDMVVCVTPSADLPELGTVCKRIAGRMMQIGKGVDMFVYDDLSGEYVGRICQYRDCRPGIRRCRADHCRMRPYLKDDLSTIRLPAFVRKNVPVELHPTLRYNPPEAPEDVSEILLAGRWSAGHKTNE
jgi:predicted nucleotidyltransferase